MNLHEKILAIMRDVQYVNQDTYVEFKNTKYKALSEEKVTSIMRAEMTKYNIVVYPIEQRWERIGQISHVDVKYKMVNGEDPTDYIEIVSCGDGADTQDKGAGKAMTYAYKYMWLRTFALPTGEDPDKVSSAELDAKQEAEDALITDKEQIYLKELCTKRGLNAEKVFKDWPNLTADQYVQACKRLEQMQEVKSHV